jgi:HupE/UreJ protein
MRRLRTVGALTLILIAAMRLVAAHSAATTTIAVTIRPDRGVDVVVTADADTLRTKLITLSGRRTDLQVRQPWATLVDRIDLRVDDDRRIPLTFAGIDLASTTAVVHLSGSLRDADRRVTVGASFIYGSYALTVSRPGVNESTVQWLNGFERSQPIAIAQAPASRRWHDLARNVWLGYSHILPGGLDHILFVLGLFLLNGRLRSILLQVSAFTLAHSITLGLTLYGVVSLPASVVEPMIAVSIVYVACENLLTTSLRPWRIGLVFLFGLLHGMGFAEALARLHLERSQFLATLVTFNVGVEAGQLTVLALAGILVRALALSPSRHHRMVVRPASIAIAIVGAVWVVQRL